MSCGIDKHHALQHAAFPCKNGPMQASSFHAEIQELKKRKNAVILAHYYQDSEIQDVADFVGDSLELARAAQKTTADLIVFAGVHFMAEGAKILNPSRKVVLPDLRAGCSLSDSCPPDAFAEFKKAHPDHFVVSYINCSAAIKAQSDVICTSSNAVKIVNQAPKDRPILFAPDRNLGAYVEKQTGRKMTLWQGACIVHETFSEKKLVELKVRNPDAEIIAHPECEPALLSHADFVGSTSALIRYAAESPKSKFIVVTEAGILHPMQKKVPHKTLLAAPPTHACSCNECPFMKLNTLEKVRDALLNEGPEIDLTAEMIEKAKRPLETMLAWS